MTKPGYEQGLVSEYQRLRVEFARHFEDEQYSMEAYDIDSKDYLAEVAALDAELFGQHKSLPVEGFVSVVENGGIVLGIRDGTGSLVGEASVILNNSPEDGDSQIERSLPSNMAYCDGAAIHPSARGKGLQRWLLRAREMVALAAGKELISASVRHRNLASIKSMLREGYFVVADAPHYYGDSTEDARIFLVKVVGSPNPMNMLTLDYNDSASMIAGITDPTTVPQSMSERRDIIALSVENSDDVDEHFNSQIALLLRGGYVAVNSHEIDLQGNIASKNSAIMFVRVASVESELFDKLSDIQRLLHNIFV